MIAELLREREEAGFDGASAGNVFVPGGSVCGSHVEALQVDGQVGDAQIVCHCVSDARSVEPELEADAIWLENLF